MHARLFCVSGDLAGSTYTVTDAATIGRGSENEVALRPTVISGRHARIYLDADGQGYVLEDCGSANGTMLDGVSVHDPVRLGHLHVITFARQHDFVFQVVEKVALAAPDSPRETPAPHAPPPVQEEQKTYMGDPLEMMTPPAPVQEEQKTAMGDPLDVLRPPGGRQPAGEPSLPGADFKLDVRTADGLRLTFDLREGANVVGRDGDCDVVLAKPSVSRRHAILTVRGQSVRLKDLGSRNATLLDGQRVATEVEIRPGAKIQFGPNITAILRRQ